MDFDKKTNISSRVNRKTKDWYWREANKRKISLSEFLRSVPDIIKSLEATLDERDNIIRNMQGRIFELEKKITEMEEWACQ